MGKYEQLAKEIIENVGGESNINGLTHCVTRLRFKLKDESKANDAALKANEGVVTVMKSGGQYQVVIGNHVDEVYRDVVTVGKINTDTSSAPVSSSKENIFNRFIDIISGVFQPVLGIMAAGGMIKGLLELVVFLGWITNTSGAYMIWKAAGDALFSFLPIILGYTSANKFGLNKYMGMILGAALVYPGISGLGSGDTLMTLFAGTVFESPVSHTFLGIPVIFPQASYVSTVIPIIATTYFASKVEKLAVRITPSVVRTFVVPFLTLVIVVPIAFLAIGPVTSWLSALIGAAITTVYNLSPVAAGVVLGAVWQVLVIFGLHWGVVPIAILNWSNTGFDQLLSLIFAASWAQTAVVLGIMIKTRNKKLKALALPSVISGIFGVTEPAIYGITLPRIKYFIISCVGAALGGGIIGFFQVKAYSVGAMGIFAIPSFIEPGSNNLMPVVYMLLAAGVAVVISLIVTLILYKDSDADLEAGNASNDLKLSVTQEKIHAPLEGKVLLLDQVDDDAFAQGALGKGVAIIPENGTVKSPVDGVVMTLFPTLHAIGIVSEGGAEVLIHIGMDTVELNGAGFSP